MREEAREEVRKEVREEGEEGWTCVLLIVRMGGI